MLAVVQTIETVLFAGRLVPENVRAVPGTAMSGAAFRTPIVAAGLPGSTSGPGSAGAPGTAGAGTGPGVASAGAERSRAPVSAAPTATNFRILAAE